MQKCKWAVNFTCNSSIYFIIGVIIIISIIISLDAFLLRFMVVEFSVEYLNKYCGIRAKIKCTFSWFWEKQNFRVKVVDAMGYNEGNLSRRRRSFADGTVWNSGRPDLAQHELAWLESVSSLRQRWVLRRWRMYTIVDRWLGGWVVAFLCAALSIDPLPEPTLPVSSSLSFYPIHLVFIHSLTLHPHQFSWYYFISLLLFLFLSPTLSGACAPRFYRALYLCISLPLWYFWFFAPY